MGALSGHRRRLPLVMALVALAAAAAGGWLTAQSGAAPPRAGSRPTSGPPPAAAPRQAANRRAAAADAIRLLGLVRLPAGAATRPSEPSGDRGALARPPLIPAGVRLIDRHGWWTVPESPRAVFGYLSSHHPAGARRTGATVVGGGGGPSLQSVTYWWPAEAGVLGLRQLAVALAPLAGGRTGVRADAEVQWIVPRPASERIPPQARVLQVSLSGPGTRRLRPATVTRRRTVDAIASAIDKLPIVQPGGIGCPMIPVQPMVTFTFRATRSGPVLARARQLQNATTASGACGGAMSLTIRGRPAPALQDGPSVIRLARRLGL